MWGAPRCRPPSCGTGAPFTTEVVVSDLLDLRGAVRFDAESDDALGVLAQGPPVPRLR